MNNYSKKIQNKNEDLISKENKYKNEISSLEQKIKDMEENHKNNFLKLTNDGKNKDVKLKDLSKENNSLKKNLEDISLKLDKMIYKSASNPRKILKKVKMDETKKKESNYEQIIIMKDKEIQNKKQLIEILEKDNQYLKNSMKRINNKGVTNDGNKLKKQNSEIMKIRENYKIIKK